MTRRSLLLWLPLPLAILVSVSFALGDLTTPRDSVAVLTLFNTLFLGSVSLLTAAVAWFSARSQQQVGVGLLGCGALTLGLVALLAGPLLHDVNNAITVFNIGLAAAGLCFAASALMALRSSAHDGRLSSTMPTLGFLVVLLGVVLLTLAASFDLTPAFYTLDEGSSPVRNAVLSVALAAFTLSSVVFLIGYRRSHHPFARWFSAGFGMMAVGILLVWIYVPGTPGAWTGRASQWLAAVYMLVGILMTAREVRSFSLPLRLALSEAELRLRLVMDAAGIGGFELDLERKLLHCDERVRALCRVDRDEKITLERLYASVHPDDLSLVQARLDEAASGEERELSIEYRLRSQDGERRVWVLMRATVISADGSPARLLGIMFDITERKLIEQAALEARARRAAEEERARLARDLHDSITQALFATALKAEALTQDERLPGDSIKSIEEVRRLSRGAVAQLRTLLLELRSQPLEEMPIDQLLRNVVEATEGRVDISIDLVLRGTGRPPSHLNTMLYRVTQEALNNVARHSRARRATVELEAEDGHVTLLIHDDGCGFEQTEFGPQHVGMRSMRERAEEVGALLRIISTPGDGTLITLSWTEGAAKPVGVSLTAPPPGAV